MTKNDYKMETKQFNFQMPVPLLARLKAYCKIKMKKSIAGVIIDAIIFYLDSEGY